MKLLTKEIEKKSFLGVNYKVVRFEPLEIMMTDECPNCGKTGIPKIDKKSNRWNYHNQVNEDSVRGASHKNPSRRPDEYRLTYDHKIDGKTEKCIVSTLDKLILDFKKRGKTHSKTIGNIFPNYLRSFRHE